MNTARPLALALSFSLAFLAACSSGGGGSDSDGGAKALAVSLVAADPGSSMATVTWTTDRAASSAVEFGLDASYGQGAGSLARVTAHEVELSGLAPSTTYHFRVVSEAKDGAVAASADATFTTLPPAAPAAGVSDDFDRANLDRGLWRFDDPHGAATLRMVGAGTGDAQLELTVRDEDYNPWLVNNAARVTQPVADVDLALEVVFTNGLSQAGTGNGIVVAEDDSEFARFDFAFNSGKVQVFAATFQAGALVDSYVANAWFGTWDEGQPLWMRVERTGDDWLQRWSLDGTSWTTGASFNFAMTVRRAGLHAITSGATPPEHTARADWFFDLAAPIASEDDGAPADIEAPWRYRVDSSPLDDSSIRVRWWTDEPSTGRVQYGLDTSYVGGVVDSLTPAYEHEVVLTGLLADTEYHFRVLSEDALSQGSWSFDLTDRTYPAGVNGQPAITFWYGTELGSGENVQRFGHLGNAQGQVNVVGSVDDDDELRLVDTVELYYRLNGGSWTQLALGDDRTISYDPWRLANEGDFNLDLHVEQLDDVPLIGGVYRNVIEFVAEDDEAHQSFRTVYLDYTPNVTWSGATSVDWSDVLLNEAGDLQAACQVVDGDWYVDDHPTLGPGLRPRADALGYDRLVAIGEGHGLDAWDDYEVEVPVTVLGLDPEGYTSGTQSYAFGFLLRWSGHTAGGPFPQPNHDIYPLGGGFFYRWFDAFERWELWVNENEAILPLAGNPVQLGTTYRYKLRCETQPAGGTRYRMKLWADGSAEPAGWSYDHTTSPNQDHLRGSLLFVAHHVDAVFGDVVVTPLP